MQGFVISCAIQKKLHHRGVLVVFHSPFTFRPPVWRIGLVGVQIARYAYTERPSEDTTVFIKL